MKYLFLLLIVNSLIINSLFSQSNRITISGKVTDFNNNPIDSALVEIKDNSFKTLYSTYSNKNGNYNLIINEGAYIALSCVKMSDYAINKLEYWAWNIQAFHDLILNVRYDRLEIYGVNVFKIQGAFPGYSIYFRPMSLTRLQSNFKDISPSIDNLDIKVKINGQNVTVNSVQKISEYCKNQEVYGFLIQTDLPDSTMNKYDVIELVGRDKENEDTGEAIYFKVKEKYF